MPGLETTSMNCRTPNARGDFGDRHGWQRVETGPDFPGIVEFQRALDQRSAGPRRVCVRQFYSHQLGGQRNSPPYLLHQGYLAHS